MCLFAAVYRVFPDCPLLILANREESRTRPTGEQQLFENGSGRGAWFGGVDLLAGGTWLGINEFGLVVAVTNHPELVAASELRSRGLLCRDLLGCSSIEEAVQETHRQLDSHAFAGFNLLMLSRDRAMLIEAGDEVKTVSLAPGIHVIANGSLNDPRDARIRRVRTELESVKERTSKVESLILASQNICGLPANSESPAICLPGADWGTVSSTVIALTANPAEVCYDHAPGPPDETPYEDYSQVVQQLLRRKVVRSLKVHRIHLRGPWEYEWISDSPNLTKPQNRSERGSFPATGRVKMPADWESIFGAIFGTVRFRRRFHQPTNLDPHERVFIVFDGVGGAMRVWVNSRELGRIEETIEPIEFEVTELLRPSNLLVVEIEFNADADGLQAGELWAAVAIEIRSG